ncbi:MAG TPA: sulfotransferase domain-containing protein [Chloroflexota bacterium]
MLQALYIEKKCKPHPLAVASVKDFACEAGEGVDLDILDEPRVTLYCLDNASRRAIFVETDPDVEATESTFLWQGQYEHARRLLALPYDDLRRLAGPIDGTGITFIHSVGRCGSTLLTEAFREAGSVTSLAEPDVYTQIAGWRSEGKWTDSELIDLARSATAFLLRPAAATSERLSVVKLRGIWIADLLRTALPEASHVFLYRGLRSWIVSSARAYFTLFDNPSEESWARLVRHLARYSPFLAEELQTSRDVPSPLEVLALQWLSVVHRYVEERERTPMLRVRYEDMVAHPHETIGSVFHHVGLPGESVSAGVRTFERDSQEGTLLSRDAIRTRAGEAITEREWDRVRAVVERYPLSCSDARALPDIALCMVV